MSVLCVGTSLNPSFNVNLTSAMLLIGCICQFHWFQPLSNDRRSGERKTWPSCCAWCVCVSLETKRKSTTIPDRVNIWALCNIYSNKYQVSKTFKKNPKQTKTISRFSLSFSLSVFLQTVEQIMRPQPSWGRRRSPEALQTITRRKRPTVLGGEADSHVPICSMKRCRVCGRAERREKAEKHDVFIGGISWVSLMPKV